MTRVPSCQVFFFSFVSDFSSPVIFSCYGRCFCLSCPDFHSNRHLAADEERHEVCRMLIAAGSSLCIQNKVCLHLLLEVFYMNVLNVCTVFFLLLFFPDSMNL